MESKRIGSTVVLIIFLALICFLCWLDISGTVNLTSSLAKPTPVEPTGDGTQDMIAAGIIALATGVAFLFIAVASGFTTLISLICLGFSIRNTKVENKPVRVINIILSCCFAAAAALGVIAIILLRVL